MTLKDLCAIVEGRAVCGAGRLGENIGHGFASDLMSDVLTIKDRNFILITGLANVQMVRTAEMSDIWCMLLCRGKEVNEEMMELAEENDMVIIASPFSVFKCSGLLYGAGLQAMY